MSLWAAGSHLSLAYHNIAAALSSWSALQVQECQVHGQCNTQSTAGKCLKAGVMPLVMVPLVMVPLVMPLVAMHAWVCVA